MESSRGIEAVVRVSFPGGQRLPKLGPLFPRKAIASAWNVGDPILGSRVHRVSGLAMNVPEAPTEEGAVLNALTVLDEFSESLAILRKDYGVDVAVDVPCYLQQASLTVELAPDLLARLAAARCALQVSCYATSGEEDDSPMTDPTA